MTDFDKWLKEDAYKYSKKFVSRKTVAPVPQLALAYEAGARAAQEWLQDGTHFNRAKINGQRALLYRQEIDRLKSALEFYADPEHWTLPYVEGSLGDYGSIARQALSDHKKAMEEQ